MKLRVLCVVAAFWSLILVTVAQTSADTASALPRLVRFGGTVKDLNGSPLTGLVGITFAFYSEKTGGAPLWLETQSVTADSNGHYTVLLGSTKPEGLPVDLFTSEQARWVGAQVSGQPEQPRVLLVSAPYALKAGDAETIGGLPPSAFVLAAPPTIGSTPGSSAVETVSPLTATDVTTTGGTANYLPIFSGAATILDSAVFQTGSGTTAKVGINTATPAAALDVKGGTTVRGTISSPSIGAATATKGTNSYPQDFVASSFSSTISTAINQTFQWQAEPAANDTANPAGTLNLLFGLGATPPSETGLKFSSKGLITFAAGQTFPGTAKSIGLAAPASDFTVSGSPVTGTGTLNLAWKVAPTNASTANAIVKRDASGNFSAGAITAASSKTSGAVVTGTASSTTGTARAVEGITDSTAGKGIGVYGQANGTGSAGGTGVYGQIGTQSSTASGLLASGAPGVGVWGDAGDLGIPYGVLGTADDGGYAGYFEGYGNITPTLNVFNTLSGGFVFNASDSSDAGCYITSGSLICTGTKSAVVGIDGGARKVALSAIESPKNWFEDAGAAELVNGRAVVTLDPDFIQTVNTEVDYKVFPVPNEDCKGLYVTNKTATSFEVRELGGGTSRVRFDYRIMAIRKKYENVRFADHTHDLDGQKRMLARAHSARER